MLAGSFFPLFCEEKLQKSPLNFGLNRVALSDMAKVLKQPLQTETALFSQPATLETPKAVAACFNTQRLYTLALYFFPLTSTFYRPLTR